MDFQKTVQVLKKIFDEYGTEIVQDSKRFQSAISDSFSQWNDKEEKIIWKHTTESDALQILLASTNITADSAERAVEQLKRESRMTQEDAEFVVRSVAAACGFDPDIVTENEKRQQAEETERIRREEEQRRQEKEREKREKEQRRQEEECRKQEEQRRQEEECKKQEEQRRQEEEQNRQEEKRKKQEEAQKRLEVENVQKKQEEAQKQQIDNSNVFVHEKSCSLRMKGWFGSKKGTAQLYPYKLKWISENGREEIEVNYQDVAECKIDYGAFRWYAVALLEIVILTFGLIIFDIIFGDESIVLAPFGAILIIGWNIIVGFPIRITQYNQKKYYLHTGKAKLQKQLTQQITECIAKRS